MPHKFASSQIFLHWLTLLLLTIAYAAMELRGFAQRGSWQGFTLIVTHFSAGTLVLIVMCLRLWLRLRHRTPPIHPAPPRWQTGLAHLTHSAIYLLFIALPLIGIASRYFRGRDWWLFGVTMPVAPLPDMALSTTLSHWHVVLAPLGYWLIGLHAVAALAHHYFFKDNTLLRISPFHQK
ncbi:cytochrome b561 [Atlantibacter subterranea]|uniref:Cytochrome b561 n=1 Tax=Atlantibacter subterraneus TaxID=255519 RepID=A0A427V1W0_9ENTR|nr:cytochrome b561 [Atlantibacter subterranea]MDA3133353.1 cytochrome b561 [Atlantibacter subterranea]RSB62579.1 cytochrome b561 [Atlantibacter subterranea]RSE03526.1 cytochrome b561 [Atlantibacter subterranea]RSE26771.1 cytochrome b561 [Atlantibacter subterranea]